MAADLGRFHKTDAGTWIYTKDRTEPPGCGGERNYRKHIMARIIRQNHNLYFSIQVIE